MKWLFEQSKDAIADLERLGFVEVDIVLEDPMKNKKDNNALDVDEFERNVATRLRKISTTRK